MSVFRRVLSRFRQTHREHLYLPSAPPSSDHFRPIEQLLAQAIQDQQYAPDFFRSLLNLELVAIQGRRGLVTLTDGAGEAYVPVYSNRDYVPDSDFGAGTRVIEKRGREILSLARGCRVVLNPGRVHSREFSAEGIATILDRLARKPLPAFLP